MNGGWRIIIISNIHHNTLEYIPGTSINGRTAGVEHCSHGHGFQLDRVVIGQPILKFDHMVFGKSCFFFFSARWAWFMMGKTLGTHVKKVYMRHPIAGKLMVLSIRNTWGFKIMTMGQTWAKGPSEVRIVYQDWKMVINPVVGFYTTTTRIPHMGVSINGGTPQIIHVWMGFSLINHPFWVSPILGNPIWDGGQQTIYHVLTMAHMFARLIWKNLWLSDSGWVLSH